MLYGIKFLKFIRIWSGRLDWFAPIFARWSAIWLPCIPLWLGIQAMMIWKLERKKECKDCFIERVRLSMKGCIAVLFIACMELRESVRIINLVEFRLGTIERAWRIARSSAIMICTNGEDLYERDMLWDGI